MAWCRKAAGDGEHIMFQELWADLSNVSVFTTSLRGFVETLSISQVVMSIIAIFAVVGLVDKVRGNKYGYGEKFDEGFMAMGPLALAVVGIVALSPVLLIILKPLLTPVYSLIGASPAMFPSSILALDMGGYVMAKQLAGTNAAIGEYSGLVVASMMGITMCFTIPYALTVMKKEDQPILALGILLGIVTLPVGCFIGGLLMHFTSTPLSIKELWINTLPVIILAVLVGVALLVKQRAAMKCFTVFGRIMTGIITISPVIAIFQFLTGIRFPLFNRMVEEDAVLGGVPLIIGLQLVGLIAIVLVGAFPMILFLNRRLGGVMNALGRRVGISAESSTGLLTQLASSIPVLAVINSMDQRGKLFNIAFAVSGSFAFGDAMAFAAGVSPEMVFPVIGGKLVGGLLAILLTGFLLDRRLIRLDSPENATLD